MLHSQRRDRPIRCSRMLMLSQLPASRTGTPDNDEEDMTDEEDWRSIGTAALRGNRGSIIPHRRVPAPEVDHMSGKK